MASRRFEQFQGSLQKGVVKLYGVVTLGAGGAIASQTPARSSGFAVVKTAAKTGRYTVTLSDFYAGLLNINVNVASPTADAAITTDKGCSFILRNVTVGATARTFEIQFLAQLTVAAASTYVDAELEDSSVFYLEITLKNSSV